MACRKKQEAPKWDLIVLKGAETGNPKVQESSEKRFKKTCKQSGIQEKQWLANEDDKNWTQIFLDDASSSYT